MNSQLGIAKSKDLVSEAIRIEDNPPKFVCVIRKYGIEVARYEMNGWMLNLNSIAKCGLDKYRKENK